jgi:hypothetical protein
LAVYARACNLVTGQGDVIALVAPEIGDGPLNIVLGDGLGLLSQARAGMQVQCEPDRLVLDAAGTEHRDACRGGIAVGLESADTWEPCPDWAGLRARRTGIEGSLAPLAALCLGYAPDNVLLSLLGSPSPEHGRAAIVVGRFREAAAHLEAGWRGNEDRLRKAGAALAGLGDGLTPAGDDWLAGVMLWAWLAHPTPRRFCRILSRAAVPRTTTLSAAFLKAAASGQCSVAWHRLLATLAEGRRSGVAEAAQGVLVHGASSGLDALIGFFYLSRANRVRVPAHRDAPTTLQPAWRP